MTRKTKVKRHLRRIKKKRVTVVRKHRRRIKKRKNRGAYGILSKLKTTPKKVLIKNLKDEFGYIPEKGMEKPQLMVIYKDFTITKKLEEKARQRKIVEDFFRGKRRLISKRKKENV